MQLEIVKDPNGDYLLKPGQAFWSIMHMDEGKTIKPQLYICCPKCGKTAGTWRHEYKIEEYGIVTLSPSLQCPIQPCDAHYFIERNTIRFT